MAQTEWLILADRLGILAGGIGISLFIYLHWVAPGKYPDDAKLGLLFLGSATWLMSGNAFNWGPMTVAALRIAGLTILAFLQIALAFKIHSDDRIPGPRESVSKAVNGSKDED